MEGLKPWKHNFCLNENSGFSYFHLFRFRQSLASQNLQKSFQYPSKKHPKGIPKLLKNQMPILIDVGSKRETKMARNCENCEGAGVAGGLWDAGARGSLAHKREFVTSDNIWALCLSNRVSRTELWRAVLRPCWTKKDEPTRAEPAELSLTAQICDHRGSAAFQIFVMPGICR